MRSSIRSLAALSAALLLAACTGGGSPSAPSQASQVPQSTEAATPGATPDACAAANLQTLTPGKLTIGTDNPAYPPYFQIPDPKPSDSPWELGDPRTGKGLEAGVAYALAAQLGFSMSNDTWVVVPFNNAIQPGPKAFDIYLAQVSYSADRANAVDLSDGYFDLNQAVVALQANAISKVTDVAGLKDFKLGAPVGTTSYQYIVDNIQPTKDPAVYDTLDAALAALNAKQIDGVVVDLPTAFFARDAELTGGVIVGSLPTVGEVEHFSIVLNKGSSLTPCVNQALAALKADGTLAGLVQHWITSQGAPELK